MNQEELNQILNDHNLWLNNKGGKRAYLHDSNLQGAYLQNSNLQGCNLQGAYLQNSNLQDADLQGCNLQGAYLQNSNLQGANLQGCNLHDSDLQGAYLQNSNLQSAYLQNSNLQGANLQGCNLQGANLYGCNLQNAKGLVKIMGVEPGNYYWKAIGEDLTNENYKFKLGLNTLREGEIFSSDDRILCSFPGFHFASKSWCKVNYKNRPYLCKIRIPENAKINEPWATNGKASADMIEIIQVLEMKTEKDITEKFK